MYAVVPVEYLAHVSLFDIFAFYSIPFEIALKKIWQHAASVLWDLPL